jgi:membrane protein DedA with SNARE-associated domain
MAEEDSAITTAILNFITNLFDTLGYAGIAVAMAIESCCIPLPSELIMPFAGYMSGSTFHGTTHFTLAAAIVAGVLGETCGSLLAYTIGAKGGRPLLLRYGKYVLISPRDAEKADAFFAKYGDRTVFFARLMPIVRTFISLPAGIARMNLVKFVIFTAAGSALWCTILAVAGYKLAENWQNVGGTIRKYDLLVGILIVALIGLFLYRHLRRPETVH